MWELGFSHFMGIEIFMEIVILKNLVNELSNFHEFSKYNNSHPKFLCNEFVLKDS